jgi:hypothetical protein
VGIPQHKARQRNTGALGRPKRDDLPRFTRLEQVFPTMSLRRHVPEAVRLCRALEDKPVGDHVRKTSVGNQETS